MNPERLLINPINEFKKLNPRLKCPIFAYNQCVSSTMEFKDLCRDKYGLDEIEDFHYWPKDYGINLVNVANKPARVHAVAILGNLVIDWSARQFKGLENTPFPFIYKLDEYNKYFGGILYKKQGSELGIIKSGDNGKLK